MADKKISELTALTGALNVADALPIADDSASQTKKINPKNLIEQGVLIIDDGSIPLSKLDSSAGIPAGSVGTTELADGSVTAIKLADNSSGVVGAALPASGIRIGQVALETTGNRFYCWNGSQWVAIKAAGSVNEITTTGGGLLTVVITENADSVNIDVVFAPTGGPSEFIAGPTAVGGTVTARPIVGEDLPTASAGEKGAVKVSGEGLRMDADLLAIDNDVVANNAFHLCQFNGKGLIINSRPVESVDLPLATNSTAGIVMPGSDLTISAGGVIDHESKGVAGTFSKVTVNDTGHVTVGGVLEESDLPNFSGDIINDNSLDGASIANRSITEIKLADYSTAYIQEGQPAGDHHVGQLWFTPSTSQLRIYARGSGSDYWAPVGFGALQSQNLRWGGTFNADTAQILTVTAIGASEGYKAGDPIPVPTDELSGMYFICQVGGSNVNQPNVQADTFTEGDWLLCINEAQGYTHIDTIGGGSGGGGATYLKDLLDVAIDTVITFGLADGQALVYNGSTGLWNNRALTADEVGALAPGDNISELNNDSGFITDADVGDGTITITDSDGTEIGSFTVNQAGDTDIALPAIVEPGDGKLSIVDQDDNELFAFTADQATGTDTVVKLSAADVGALPDDTPLEFVPLGSWAALPTL